MARRRDGCEFTGSLGDQVFRCINCDAFPEDCEDDGDCCCPKPDSGDAALRGPEPTEDGQ